MDVNEYLLSALVRQRVDDMQTAARMAAIRAAARPRRPLRVIVGHLLVRAGTRLAGFTPARLAA